MKVKAANGFARALKAEGIPWVSCYPTNHVNNALGEEGVPILMMGEERFAVAVADAFSRVTCGKQIGVCTIMANLNAAGIRVRLRAMERAAFYADWKEKKLRGIFMTAVGNSGNAASRVEAFIQSRGAYAYGGYPDIDDLFQQQERERDVKKREALLFKIQQLTIDRAMFAPVMDLRALMGIGPRVGRHTITDVWMSPFPAYEDMELKG